MADVSSLVRKANSLLDIDRATEALATLSDAARMEPEDRDLLCTLSRAYNYLADYDKALHYANLAVQAAPDSEYPHRLRYYALSNAGKHPESLEAASTSLECSPSSVFCARCVAAAEINCKLYDAAESHAKLALDMDPDAAESHCLLAEIYFKQKRWEEARRYLTNALELEPNGEKALALQSRIETRQHGVRRALPHYLGLLRLYPDNDVAHNGVLGAFFNVGDTTHSLCWLGLMWAALWHFRINPGLALCLSVAGSRLLPLCWCFWLHSAALAVPATVVLDTAEGTSGLRSADTSGKSGRTHY